MFQYFGIASGIITGLSSVPYIRDILRHKTKPERASWFIWSILGAIAFFSQMAEGATDSLWLTGIDSLGVLITFLLAIKYGVGGFNRRDILALIVAGIGLLLWFFTHQAAVALFIIICIDLSGTILTVAKSYTDPESETLTTWIIMSVAGILAMISVGEFNPILLIYPLYIFLANFAVVVAMLLGRAKINKSKI
jgi:hypothetical protein